MDPYAHGVHSLSRLSVRLSIFSKPSEDLVNTVNVVNVVKTNIMMTLVDDPS